MNAIAIMLLFIICVSTWSSYSTAVCVYGLIGGVIGWLLGWLIESETGVISLILAFFCFFSPWIALLGLVAWGGCKLYKLII